MRANPKAEEFKTKYPLLFKEGCLRSGFYCPEGWLPLVHRLCSVIEHQINNYIPEEIRGEIYINQIKEKFGTLRVYLNQETPYISGAIAMAEAMSHITCDTCGLVGKIRTGSYTQTLCDICSEERSKRKIK
jgi:hypothetical protein